jgi:ubiquinone/menaquinone biosynthesis C-methylase UbiE
VKRGDLSKHATPEASQDESDYVWLSSLGVIAEYFDGRASTYDRKEFHKQVADRIAAEYGQNRAGRVLDIGTGTGLVLRRLMQKSDVRCAIGIDLSREMIACARKEVPQGHFVVGDAHHLPFRAAATFDNVFCVSSLLYFDDPRKAMLEASRVCAPDGVVILATFRRA